MGQDPASRSMRWRKRIGAAVCVSICVAGGAVYAIWPRNDIPNQPDAVVVLGGAGIERVELGNRLRHEYGAILVLSAQAPDYGWYLGLICGRDAICIEPGESSTAGEARAVAALVAEQGWRHVTIATSNFHTARSRILFRQCLGDRVTVVGAPPQHQRGLGTYPREMIATLAALTIRRAC
jgi:uncharacterized SAM-binding protein YcdF (DUF218 family)